MVRMLDDGQHTQACFVAHSLGTTAVSWMLHDTEGEELYLHIVRLDEMK